MARSSCQKPLDYWSPTTISSRQGQFGRAKMVNGPAHEPLLAFISYAIPHPQRPNWNWPNADTLGNGEQFLSRKLRCSIPSTAITKVRGVPCWGTTQVSQPEKKARKTELAWLPPILTTSLLPFGKAGGKGGGWEPPTNPDPLSS